MVLGPTLNRPASLYSFLTVLPTLLFCADILTSFARKRHVFVGSSIFANVVTGDAPRTGPWETVAVSTGYMISSHVKVN